MQPFYVGFEIGGFELGLDPDINGVNVGNNAVAYWGVADIEEAYRRLLDRGAEARQFVKSGTSGASSIQADGTTPCRRPCR